MTFKELSTYTVVCDGCGKDINADNCEYSGTSLAGCRVDIENADWITSANPMNGEPDGRHFCPDCTCPHILPPDSTSAGWCPEHGWAHKNPRIRPAAASEGGA